MSDKTGIEWTDATWNPIRGCTRVSEGCRNCYAESTAMRFSGEGLPYEGLVRIGGDGKAQGWSGQIQFVEKHLLDPLKWKKPRRIFVNSMSDLFHEGVTDEMRDRIFAVMALCPQHTFQVLTKRPKRMREYLDTYNPRYTVRKIFDAAEAIDPQHGSRFDVDVYWPLSNLWLGVSVENQQAADERIPLLLQTPAAVRFLSCEPLLGPVLLDNGHASWLTCHGTEEDRKVNDGYCCDTRMESQGTPFVQCFRGIDWVIAGGESGRNARPMHPDWARVLRDQCAAAGVPFFFKQWGEWAPAWGDATHILSKDGELVEATHEDPRAWKLKTHEAMRRVGKKAAGHLLDGVEHHAFPEVRS